MDQPTSPDLQLQIPFHNHVHERIEDLESEHSRPELTDCQDVFANVAGLGINGRLGKEGLLHRGRL
jgi:uncharacterized protein (UPF0335 family)